MAAAAPTQPERPVSPVEPCPFWKDRAHCFRDDSHGGTIGVSGLRALGAPVIPIKVCACGATVKGPQL